MLESLDNDSLNILLATDLENFTYFFCFVAYVFGVTSKKLPNLVSRSSSLFFF